MAVDPDLLKLYCDLCRKSGAVQEVGPERYAWFAGLSDDQMEDLLVELAWANHKEINRMLFAEPRKASMQELIDFMETMLNLVVRGYIALNPGGELGCFAPEGPPPTEAEEAGIDHRIRAAFPLVGRALLRAAGASDEDVERLAKGHHPERS